MEQDLNALRDRAYSIAKAHGFHEKEYSDETYLMLIIAEIAEAVNADRKNYHARIKEFEDWQKEWNKELKDCPYSEHYTANNFKDHFKAYINESVESELADVAICILDFAGDKGINFEEYDILGCDNNFCGDNSFCEKCYYLCRLVGNNMNYIKLEHKIKVILADVFSLAQRCNIDLFRFIDLKMKYNELRPYKNGKKY
jgi:NTP pyrophosphatase (non-canonical NTP hydrolase)